VCARCVTRAECETTGHQWGEWGDVTQPYRGGLYVGRVRSCDHCFRTELDPPLSGRQETADPPTPGSTP
jgi:hypothetical protein